MRRAKIVCTLGPATSTPESILELVRAGMDVARLNLSHGDYPVHEQVYMDVRRASDETEHAVGILVDLQGPKLRTGRFAAITNYRDMRMVPPPGPSRGALVREAFSLPAPPAAREERTALSNQRTRSLIASS